MNNLLDKHNETNKIDFQDLSSSVFETFENQSSEINVDLQAYIRMIEEKAKQEARNMIGAKTVKTASIKKVAYDSWEEGVNKAFTSISSIPQDIVDKIKEEWIENGAQRDLIPQLLQQEEQSLKEQGLDPSELKEALHQLFTKQKHVYKNVIRTVSINAYATAQLQEWLNEGIEEVERISIDDLKTCAICRSLSSPGRNIYKIKDLLALNEPVTGLSHPQCRCNYIPIVKWDNLDLDFIESGNTPIVDIENDYFKIKNAPLGFQEQISELNDRVGLRDEFEFVPNVVDSKEWYDDKIQSFVNQGYTSQNAKAMTDIEKEENRDTIQSYKSLNGKTILSGTNIDSTAFGYALLIQKASEQWSNLLDKDFWYEDYADLISSNKPFITLTAEESAQQLFIEEFIQFHINPVKLLSLDSFGYDEIAKLTGNDFLEIGAPH